MLSVLNNWQAFMIWISHLLDWVMTSLQNRATNLQCSCTIDCSTAWTVTSSIRSLEGSWKEQIQYELFNQEVSISFSFFCKRFGSSCFKYNHNFRCLVWQQYLSSNVGVHSCNQLKHGTDVNTTSLQANTCWTLQQAPASPCTRNVWTIFTTSHNHVHTILDFTISHFMWRQQTSQKMLEAIKRSHLRDPLRPWGVSDVKRVQCVIGCYGAHLERWRH